MGDREGGRHGEREKEKELETQNNDVMTSFEIIRNETEPDHTAGT